MVAQSHTRFKWLCWDLNSSQSDRFSLYHTASQGVHFQFTKGWPMGFLPDWGICTHLWRCLKRQAAICHFCLPKERRSGVQPGKRGVKAREHQGGWAQRNVPQTAQSSGAALGRRAVWGSTWQGRTRIQCHLERWRQGGLLPSLNHLTEPLEAQRPRTLMSQVSLPATVVSSGSREEEEAR